LRGSIVEEEARAGMKEQGKEGGGRGREGGREREKIT